MAAHRRCAMGDVRRTKPCPHTTNGRCTRGGGCPYLHDAIVAAAMGLNVDAPHGSSGLGLGKPIVPVLLGHSWQCALVYILMHDLLNEGPPAFHLNLGSADVGHSEQSGPLRLRPSSPGQCHVVELDLEYFGGTLGHILSKFALRNVDPASGQFRPVSEFHHTLADSSQTLHDVDRIVFDRNHTRGMFGCFQRVSLLTQLGRSAS